MYLSRLYIKNFRSIEDLDLNFSKGKNIIVGRNNAGKSNIIKAIDLVLGENTPTYTKSENITDSDFHTWKEIHGEEIIEHSSDDIYIWCELERDQNEPLDYEEMYRCYGFYVYSSSSDCRKKEPRRIPLTELPKNYKSIFQIKEDEEDRFYVNPKLRNQGTLEQQFDNKYYFAFAFLATRDNNGKIEKDIRFLYRENKTADWILSFRASIRNELLQSAIIPSFRDPQTQLRLSSWNWYGKLIRYLTDKHAKSKELEQAFSGVKKVADKIFDEVETQIAESTLQVAFPGTTLHFQFNAEQRQDLYKSCIIYVDDGFKSQLTDKGSGIQSATIIGLFNFYTQYVNTTGSALLCIEEPEIYLHPHACRVISDCLDSFIDNNRNQVILTTHCAHFIRTIGSNLNLTLIRKNNYTTMAYPVNIGDFKHLLVNSNQIELFFSDKVIVCEGLDEHILILAANELFPGKLNEQNISVVSVGGKDNIKSLVNLVLKLGIKCFLFADFDYLLRDRSDERKKYDAKLHDSIQSLGETFFTQDYILGRDGIQVYREIVKLRARIKNEEEQAFYTAKSLNSCKNPDIGQLLEKLRNNGVCILTGETEDLSKDPSFIKSVGERLSLEKIHELHGRLSKGESITDLFEVSEISEFLNTILNR